MKPRLYYSGDIEVKIKPSDGVMLPSPFSEALGLKLTRLDLQNVSCALDLGCGSGYHAILLAKLGIPQVFAIDSDRQAADAAEANALLNGVSEFSSDASMGVSSIHGNMFAPFRRQFFDLIVSNPPTTPHSADTPPYADGGLDGREFLSAMINGATRHLNKGGRLIFMHSSLANIGETKRHLEEAGFEYGVEPSFRHELRQRHLSHLRYYEKLRAIGQAEFEDAEEGKLICWTYIVDALFPHHSKELS